MGVIEGAPVVGLPGNPVAAFVTFIYVVQPLIAALEGASQSRAWPLTVLSGFAYKKKNNRREYVRVSLRTNSAGETVADKYPVEGAAILTSLTRTDGFVELAEDVINVSPGDRVAYIDYGLIR